MGRECFTGHSSFLESALNNREDFHVSYPCILGISVVFLDEGAFFEGYAVFAAQICDFGLAV
jgi:hypothetical protein